MEFLILNKVALDLKFLDNIESKSTIPIYLEISDRKKDLKIL